MWLEAVLSTAYSISTFSRNNPRSAWQASAQPAFEKEHRYPGWPAESWSLVGSSSGLDRDSLADYCSLFRVLCYSLERSNDLLGDRPRFSVGDWDSLYPNYWDYLRHCSC